MKQKILETRPLSTNFRAKKFATKNLVTKNLLVFRISSMGDVTLTLPVLIDVLQRNPEVSITFVSDIFFEPLFRGMERITFFPVQKKSIHRGLRGIIRLFKDLQDLERSNGKYEAVIDLHNVLRTRILSGLFSLCHVFSKKTKQPTNPERSRHDLSHPYITRINKGRGEKKKLTRRYGKQLRPLTGAVQRYAETFQRAGFITGHEIHAWNCAKHIKADKNTHNKSNVKIKKIAIAPFSAHRTKEWPIPYQIELLQMLSGQKDLQIYLLGGPSEKTRVDSLIENSLPNKPEKNESKSRILNMAGKLSFAEELKFLKGMDLLLSMDSANLHLATILGVPRISIWGPTHPWLGFAPTDSHQTMLQLHTVTCRPCSVFGNKKCFQPKQFCMTGISPEMVYKEIKRLLKGGPDSFEKPQP